MSEHNCLVLNKSYIPVETISWQDAFRKVFNGQAYAIEFYDDEIVHTPNDEFLKLAVIVCTDYNEIPPRVPLYSKKLVLQRDEWTCVYCGVGVDEDTFSIDHILPRSRGGRSSFENTVCACKPCNSKKANKTPAEAGMRLRVKPARPANLNPIRAKFDRVKLNDKWAPYVAPHLGRSK